MGNAAPASVKSPKSITNLSQPKLKRIARKVTVPSRPSSVTHHDQEKIFQEYPELKDALSYIDVTVKEMYNHKEEDTSKKTMSLSTKKSLEEIYSFYFDYEDQYHREMIGDELAKKGISSVLMDYMNILTKDGTDYPLEGYRYQCYEIVRGICWNFTDVSVKFCIEFGKIGMLLLMLQDLKEFQDTYKESSEKHFIVLSAMSILHNCASSSENIKYYKEMNAVDTIAWYAKNSGDDTEHVLSPLSNMTLALIVDEQNNDVILADDTVIKTILRLLEQSLTGEQHRSDGFSATELAFGLTRLASNERNSEIILRNGILKSLLKMMKEGSEMEQTTAAKAVWVLAFSERNKPEINSNQEVVDLLRSFSSLGSSVSMKLKKAAAGALWVLELPLERNLVSTATKINTRKKKKVNEKTKTVLIEEQSDLSVANKLQPNASPDESEVKPPKDDNLFRSDETPSGHIMISYQWDCQKLMLRVKRQLEPLGYKIWMDVDEMEGSTLQSMADGVENSAILLICLSQKYKDSVSCRTEAEYAYKLGKLVVPLRIEQGYTPDGWLGAIVGAKLYYDFSNPENFDVTFSNLLKQIGDKGKPTHPITSKPSTLQAPSNERKVEDWTAQDVSKWSYDNNLINFKTRNLDGNCLLFFKKLKREAPEFFYRYVTEQLKLKDIRDIMAFVAGIENL